MILYRSRRGDAARERRLAQYWHNSWKSLDAPRAAITELPGRNSENVCPSVVAGAAKEFEQLSLMLHARGSGCMREPNRETEFTLRIPCDSDPNGSWKQCRKRITIITWILS